MHLKRKLAAVLAVAASCHCRWQAPKTLPQFPQLLIKETGY